MHILATWHIARGIIAAHALFAAVTWKTLPARIPMHFNLAGQADSWVEPSLFFWFMLIGASLFTYLLVYVLSRPGAQDLWNIPGKKRFLKLPKEKQGPVVELVQGYGGVTVAAVGLLYFVLQVGIYLSAVGVSEGLPWYVHVMIYAIPVALLLGIFPWSRAITKSIARQESELSVS